MSGQITVEWANLDRMFAAMQQIDTQSTEITTYVNDHMCSNAGFDYPACVLRPIGDQLGTVGGWFADARDFFGEKWLGVMQTVEASARLIDQQDNQVDVDFGRYMGEMGPYVPQDFPPLTVEVALFDLQDLALDEPERPEDGQLNHNEQWESLSGGYDSLRDTINTGIDRINSLGVVSIDRLPETSLDEFVVYPLSGDYLAIGGNANACNQVQTDMSTWGMNFTLVSGEVTLALQGQVEASLIAHINAYNAVMQAIGLVVGAGSEVFDSIALVSERIAVQVENALVTMLRILGRVSAKIATRVLGWFGWAMLAKDIIERGAEAITDIVDDVRTCIEIIQACFDLKDAIEAWAEEQAQRLETFQEIQDLMETLPVTVQGGNLDDLPTVDLPALEQRLNEMGIDISFGDNEGEGQDALDDELNDLDENYGPDSETGQDAAESDGGESDSDDSSYEPDDDEMLMAPGPLGPDGGSSSTGPVV
ncbi:hypothetical protein [Nocardioides nanhaiensis]|uniref:WXG100 family type VII secretion target n=1 Tax=Nocardioides nanhaiensis TaxID=1476871 RepID=A0ABP8VUW2_9ACTN